MLGISVYIYLYLKLINLYVYLIISYVFLFNKLREQQGRAGSVWKQVAGVGGGEAVAQTIYACVSKCNNDKIQKEQAKPKIVREKK
jgi:hypothetical protein